MTTWAQHEIDTLRSMARTHTDADIAAVLKRTMWAVRKKRGALGVRKNQKRGPVCSNCRAGVVRAKGLCHACYHHQMCHGEPRPRHLYRETCRTCGRPIAAYKRRKGQCATCYMYERALGKRRPWRLIKQQAPNGWCDCGQPAITTIEITMYSRTETMPLCNDCAALEQS